MPRRLRSLSASSSTAGQRFQSRKVVGSGRRDFSPKRGQSLSASSGSSLDDHRRARPHAAGHRRRPRQIRERRMKLEAENGCDSFSSDNKKRRRPIPRHGGVKKCDLRRDPGKSPARRRMFSLSSSSYSSELSASSDSSTSYSNSRSSSDSISRRRRRRRRQPRWRSKHRVAPNPNRERRFVRSLEKSSQKKKVDGRNDYRKEESSVAGRDRRYRAGERQRRPSSESPSGANGREPSRRQGKNPPHRQTGRGRYPHRRRRSSSSCRSWSSPSSDDSFTSHSSSRSLSRRRHLTRRDGGSRHKHRPKPLHSTRHSSQQQQQRETVRAPKDSDRQIRSARCGTTRTELSTRRPTSRKSRQQRRVYPSARLGDGCLSSSTERSPTSAAKAAAVLPLQIRFQVCRRMAKGMSHVVKVFGDIPELGDCKPTASCPTLHLDPDDRNYEDFHQSDYVKISSRQPGEAVHYKYFVMGSANEIVEIEKLPSDHWRNFEIPEPELAGGNKPWTQWDSRFGRTDRSRTVLSPSDSEIET